MNSKSNTKNLKLVEQTDQRHIHNLKKHLNAVETIGQANGYRRRRLRDQNTINYKNEYDRITGELSQSNFLVQIRHALQQRRRISRDAYDDSQTAKDIIFL